MPHSVGGTLPLTEELTYFADHLDSERVEISGSQNAVDVLEILEKATISLQHNQKITVNSVEAKKDYFVHETSFVDDHVKIGANTKIWHYSHVQSGSEIGENCSLGQNVNIGNNVKIGNHCKIQNNVSVYEGVELEDYVFCGPSMVFTNIMNPRCKYPQRGSEFYKTTLVKEGASIGANATIVCGHTIGRHAFIAAGAVVTKDVPDYAMMKGVPAEVGGWMCECGALLHFDESLSTCVNCGLEYYQNGKVIELKTMESVDQTD